MSGRKRDVNKPHTQPPIQPPPRTWSSVTEQCLRTSSHLVVILALLGLGSTCGLGCVCVCVNSTPPPPPKLPPPAPNSFWSSLVATKRRGLVGGSWCSIFRQLLTEWLSLVPVKSQASIDFLLPSMNKLGSVRNQPYSYVEACMGLRRLLAEVEGVLLEAYTLHSCKATVLVWAMQLRLPEGDRAKQGHHRGSAVLP